jgi:hypothetical protein
LLRGRRDGCDVVGSACAYDFVKQRSRRHLG